MKLPTLVGIGLLTVAMLAACKRAPAGPYDERALPVPVLQFAPPAVGRTYARKRVVGQIGLPTEAMEQRWTRVTTDHLGVHFDVGTGAPGEDAKVVQRLRYGDDGVLLLAEGPVDPSGEILWEPWVPPAVLLPADPEQATSWTATHQVGEDVVQRSCELLRRTDQCPGAGIVVVCDAAWPDFRLVTREHYCDQTGWSGYESLVVRPDSPSVRTWTEGVSPLADNK